MSKTVLVVDDSTSVRQLVATTLKQRGYNILEASGGQEALNKLGGSKVDLVVSDVNMPGMDGIEMLKKLKQMPTHKFTPVLMLTTEGGQDMKAKGKAAGAKAWLVKPFQPDVLINAVSRLV